MPAPADREKALETALAQIDRQFGKGSVMRLGDESRAPIEVIPTGSIALDVALGIGGLPRGRVVEIFGPESSGKTTVALHAVASAQRSGGIAAFIDAEHALDPEYARKLGVDTDALLVSQPDTGEQALEIADMLIRSGALDIIVIDSVAALVPRAEIEGEMGDSHVGLQARLMSQALRKVTGALNTSGTTAIFINQLREKIGVMFGCFSADTRVTLADGRQEQIGRIVSERMDVEVLSYDPVSDEIVPRRVTNWFDNGPAERFLQFTVDGADGRGRSRFAATENHLIQTPGGWREAGDIRAGDRVMVAATERLSFQQWQLVLGGLMGGGTLGGARAGRLGVRYRTVDATGRSEYADWKAAAFGNLPHTRTILPTGDIRLDLAPLAELAELRDVVYFGGQHKHLTWDYLKALTPLALAVWYGDGARLLPDSAVEIPVEGLSPGSRERLVEHLRDSFGVHARMDGGRGTAVLRLGADAALRLQEAVAPYVHPALAWMLPERLRGRFAARQPEFLAPRTRPMPALVHDVQVRPSTGPMHRFDLEVDGTHNYFVDGVMVHNSPETTTGGRALKFYASVRLDVRRIETLKDGSEPVGSRTRVKVVKNKVSPPFKQAEFDILYGQGISREGGLIDMGVEQGIIRKSGAWYTYEGDQLGQGKENARSFLRDNPDLGNEIEKRIKEKLGIGPQLDAPEPPVDF